MCIRDSFQVYLEWSEENQTYQDNYIVYLRQHDLEEILTPVANDVFGECKLFAYGYSCLLYTSRCV